MLCVLPLLLERPLAIDLPAIATPIQPIATTGT